MWSFFVIPFCLGVVSLLVVSVVKYYRWINQFDERQQRLVRENIFSWRFLPALWEAFREGLLHWRITRHNLILGYMHRSLAFGWFLLIVVGAIQAILACPDGHPFYVAIFFNYFEPRSRSIVAHPYSSLMADVMDVLLLYVFSGLVLAVMKKFWSRPMGMRQTTRHNLPDRVAKAALWCIFPLRLIAESYTSAIFHNGGFLVAALGDAFCYMGIDSRFVEVHWWLAYSLALGVFFCLMPFTRYMHIFTEVFLIYFRQLGLREREARDGYTMFELSACSRCGICIDACPINSPIGINTTQGVYMLQTVRNKDLWNRAEAMADNCMVCGRCSEDCPVNIDLEAIRRQVRIEGKRKIDRPLSYGYLTNIHPFAAIGRVAYFGGCMSHLTPGITEAMERIFEAAGQKYWYMDKERSICCGRPLLQQGFANQAQRLRQKNAELIANSGATLLVTSCPICYQSFTKEYHLGIPVMHHTEYIAMLIRSGAIKVRKGGLRVAYHDPCELGRGCGVYDAPREVLTAVADLRPTAHEREHSLCCGFNLGNTVIDTQRQTLVRDAARENLLAVCPDTIATACPMCKKAFTHAADLQVRDIAEVVAENIVTNSDV
ncbi:MAG: (Fe-S)-binding protein [Bacteroidales bacterium]|nr:(Fe-S)-binding protein [Bacteroidales bacterium]